MTPTERLARIRTRLAMIRSSHFTMGAGCACGMPASHIDMSAIDSMIAGHLSDKYKSGGRTQLGELLAQASRDEKLSAFLGDVIDGQTPLADADCTLLADDLETTVNSLEEMTPGRTKSRSPRRVPGL